MFHRAKPHEDERPVYLRWLLFKQPLSATGEWWDRRDRQLAHRAPVRYWLNNVPPRWLRLQTRRLKDIKFWFLYRTTHKYHLVHTRQKPGYYEIDDRMLYSMFSLLVDYVEVGISSRNFGSRFISDAQSGVAHLEWEMSDPQCAGDQADTAKIVHDLYHWWTFERPQRRDPWSDPLIWAEADLDDPIPKPPRRFRRLSGRSAFFGRNRSPARDLAGKNATALQEFYAQQDQGMLEKLAKVRRNLWT